MKPHTSLSLLLAAAAIITGYLHPAMSAEGNDLLIGGDGVDLRTPGISAIFDPRSGVLSIVGDDQDNDIYVTRTPDGLIAINGGAVPVINGPAFAQSTVVAIEGRGGSDVIVAGGVACVAMNGGDGFDVLAWNDLDGTATASQEGSDLLIINDGDGSDSECGDFNLWNTNRDGYNVSKTADGEDLLIWNSGDDSVPLMPVEIREVLFRPTVNDSK